MLKGTGVHLLNHEAQSSDDLERMFLKRCLTGQPRIAALLCGDCTFGGKLRHLLDQFGVLPLLVHSPLTPADLLFQWCGVSEPPDETVAQALIDRVRELLSIPRPAGTVLEREWQAEAARGTLEEHENARDFARALYSEGSETAVSAVRSALDRLRLRGLTQMEQFQTVASAWGNGSRPIVMLAGQRADRLVETIRSAVYLVESVPEMRLVLIMEPNGWTRLGPLLDSHSLALLRDGLCVAEGKQLEVWRAAVAKPDAPAALAGVPLEPKSDKAQTVARESIRVLRDEARNAVEAAQKVGPAPPAPELDLPPEHDIARSLAEALLYAALQADPITTGLFRLNANGGFLFGDRPAEIDLFCSSLLIAIEVDGYFHFQDKAAYRRDRAKDWRMQREGMAVLRFLAEDVTDNLEFVMSRVVEVVSWRIANYSNEGTE